MLNPKSKAGQIKIFTVLGQLVISTELSGDTTQELSLDLPGGNYVVHIIGNDFVENTKIYVE